MLTRLKTLGRRPTLKQTVRYGMAEVFSRNSPYSAPDIYGWLDRRGVSTEDVMAAIEMAPAQNLKPSDILEELLAKRRKPPDPPINRIIRDGDVGGCPDCYGLRFWKTATGCIQPLCSNYEPKPGETDANQS